ncbi:hypothetical protein Btru_071800 [Bulinus truncatus]|nr:hypothetical protein Btru_071800 [Bulinus truncatus]
MKPLAHALFNFFFTCGPNSQKIHVYHTRLVEDDVTEESPEVASQSTEPTVQKIDGVYSRRKIHQYSDNYLVMGFTWTREADCPSPLGIICEEQLANSALVHVPAKLKRH